MLPDGKITITPRLLHMGRAWNGHTLEDNCPCDKAPCGLIIGSESTKACPEHSWAAGKTMRQGHYAELCPDLVDATGEVGPHGR